MLKVENFWALCLSEEPDHSSIDQVDSLQHVCLTPFYNDINRLSVHYHN